MERNALRLQNGIKLAMGMEFVRVGPTPKQTVWSSGKTELWRYDTEPGAVKHAPPILLVPSVVSRSYVFDLHRGNSFVERLLEAGFAVYLIDWGIAGQGGVDEHVRDLRRRADRRRRWPRPARTPARDDLTMLGYCFSGLLTCSYLAGHPDAPIRSLVSLAPPIDYSASSGITKVFAEGRLEPDDILDEDGNVPGDVVREAFAMRKPTSDLVTNAALLGQPLEGRLRRGPPGDGAVHPRAGADARRAAAPDRRQADPRQRARHRRDGAERPARGAPRHQVPAAGRHGRARRARPRGVDADPARVHGPEPRGAVAPGGPRRSHHRPQGRDGDDPAHPRMDRGPQPVPAGERGRT